MAYKDQYTNVINSTLNDINNRKPFSYNFNADPIYRQYADQYTKLGNTAMQNTIAQASTMTGGYGNSYGTTAGLQANQEYLNQLNNVIPELYNAAYSRYQDEGNQLKDKLSMYQTLSDTAYNRYRDDVADAYQKERDAVSDAQWNKTYALQKASAYKSSNSSSGSNALYSEVYNGLLNIDDSYKNGSLKVYGTNSTRYNNEVYNFLISMVKKGFDKTTAKELYNTYTGRNWDDSKTVEGSKKSSKTVYGVEK